ncbi:hypothetical protein ABT340_33495 [Streptosporangium sp. NPDC000239]|uniref:hypothetical protein n=1 Tax=Streptosporangium sp. NPDC000239 TaxID=3154248 RepID=UPI00332D89DC
MNEEELLRTEQVLRDVLTESQLEWVLDEVDSTIAAGVPEEKVLQRRSVRGNNTDDYGLAAEALVTEVRQNAGSAEYEALRKRGSLVITTRSMTVRERVQLLHDALRRVLIELPEIEEEAMKVLHSAPVEDLGERSGVTSVRFVPSETTGRRTEREIELSGSRLHNERERLSALFAAMAAEVGE